MGNWLKVSRGYKTVRVQLSNSPKEFIIDAADLPLVLPHTWSFSEGYVRTKIRGRIVTLHRHLLKPAKFQRIDHRDQDVLNNRRINLRHCTAGQNSRNRKKLAGTTSQYKGVHMKKKQGRWQATITLNYKKTHLGYFADEESAALAYNRAARKLHGKFASLNKVK